MSASRSAPSLAAVISLSVFSAATLPELSSCGKSNGSAQKATQPTNDTVLSPTLAQDLKNWVVLGEHIQALDKARGASEANLARQRAMFDMPEPAQEQHPSAFGDFEPPAKPLSLAQQAAERLKWGLPLNLSELSGVFSDSSYSAGVLSQDQFRIEAGFIISHPDTRADSAEFREFKDKLSGERKQLLDLDLLFRELHDILSQGPQCIERLDGFLKAHPVPHFAPADDESVPSEPNEQSRLSFDNFMF